MNELPQYSNNYLIHCNRTRDIENNIGVVEMPEFTVNHVNAIDRNYKKHLFKLIDIEFQDESGLFDEISIRNLNNSFELNELFIEHVDYMTELRGRVNEFAIISEKSNKIRMYFQEIVPIVQQDQDNLKEVLEILSL